MALKIIGKILATLIIILIFILAIAFVLSNVYEKEIKQMMVRKLNNHLKVEITVQEIHLDVIQKFPYASLTFQDVMIPDPLNEKDTLLKAERVFLQFSILDFVKQNYTIKRIDVENSVLRPVINKNRQSNYDIWKEDTEKKEQKSVAIALNRIKLINTHIDFKNHFDRQRYDFFTSKAFIKGNFTENTFDLSAYGNFHMNGIQIKQTLFLNSKDLFLDLILHVDHNKGRYELKKSELTLEKDHQFDIAGYITDNEKEKHIDVTIKGNQLNLLTVLALLPDKYKKSVDAYQADGELNFSAHILGSYMGNHVPAITATFNAASAELTDKKSGFSLTGVNFSGSFTNKDSEFGQAILIKDFFGKLSTGFIKGHFEIKGQKKLFIDAALQIDATIQEINEFIVLKDISEPSGRMTLNMKYEGMLSQLSAGAYMKSKAEGTGSFQNLSFGIKNFPYRFKNFQVQYRFDNNDIVFEDFFGKVEKSDFRLKGKFKNIIPFIFQENETLSLDINLKSDYLDLDELMEITETTDTAKTYRLSLPHNVNGTVRATISKLNFNKFNATQIQSDLWLHKKQLTIKHMRFNSMKGSIIGNAFIDASRDDKILISCEATLSDVDINSMFYAFNNFGQNEITEKNLKGDLNAQVSFASTWTPELSIEEENIFASAAITIENGELLDYEPINELSSFLKVRDLSHIQFATLKNNIEIRNKTIFIPEMEINSSAINLFVNGKHSFDNSIDYRIRVLLSEIIAANAKKAKKENRDFAVVEDDGYGKTSIYIHVSGTAYDPVFKYDRKSVKEKINKTIKEEKKNLKTILNKEFGWFKKDSAMIEQHKKEKQAKEQKEAGSFIFIWEGDEY